jgi:hypothetical protein
MEGEWCLEAKSYGRKFTMKDQRIWIKACKVLQEIAKYRALRVAGKLKEEDRGNRIATGCEKCSKRRGTFQVWDPAQYGGIEVPLYLKGVRGVCPCDASYHKSRRKFQVIGSRKCADPKSSFCDDLEAVVAFLLPGSFEIELDMFNADCDETSITYTLCDEDGSKLDRRLPVEFATHIRAIKHHVSTLSNLCADQLELSYGRDAAKAAIIDLGI